jgi:acyl carrier protein
MKAMGPGPIQPSRAALESPRRRALLVRSAALGAAGLLAEPARLLAVRQDTGKTAEQQLTPEEQAVDRKIVKIVAEHLDIDEKRVVPTARIWDDLGADSLDGCELVMAFEKEFDIEITCEDSANWVTVGDVMHTINAILEKKKAAATN